MSEAQIRLDQGAEYPFDASNAWWKLDRPLRTPLTGDWAVRAARGVMADLNDRRGIKQELRDIDEDVRAELVQSLAEIIRLAEAARG